MVYILDALTAAWRTLDLVPTPGTVFSSQRCWASSRWLFYLQHLSWVLVMWQDNTLVFINTFVLAIELHMCSFWCLHESTMWNVAEKKTLNESKLLTVSRKALKLCNECEGKGRIKSVAWLTTKTKIHASAPPLCQEPNVTENIQ